jgi:hypothetical protein
VGVGVWVWVGGPSRQTFSKTRENAIEISAVFGC